MKTPSRKPSPEAVAFATDCMAVWDDAEIIPMPKNVADAMAMLADDAECCGLPVTTDFLRAAAGVVMSRVETRIAAEFWTAAATRSDS